MSNTSGHSVQVVIVWSSQQDASGCQMEPGTIILTVQAVLHLFTHISKWKSMQEWSPAFNQAREFTVTSLIFGQTAGRANGACQGYSKLDWTVQNLQSQNWRLSLPFLLWLTNTWLVGSFVQKVIMVFMSSLLILTFGLAHDSHGASQLLYMLVSRKIVRTRLLSARLQVTQRDLLEVGSHKLFLLSGWKTQSSKGGNSRFRTTWNWEGHY